MRNPILVALTSCLLTSCATAVPKWYSTGSHREHPPELYVLGMGSGDNYESAQDNALAEIARQIEVSVESEVTKIVSGYTTAEGSAIREEFQSIVKTAANASLQGAQAVEKTIEDNIHYVLCVLDKQKYAAGLKTDLDTRRDAILKMYVESENQIDDGDVFDGLQTLFDAGQSTAEFETRSVFYASFTGRPYPGSSDVKPGSAVRSVIVTKLGRLALLKIDGDNQIAEVGSELPNPLKLKVVYVKSSGDSIPVMKMKLALRDEFNQILERKVTSNRGTTEFDVRASGKTGGEFTVTLDWADVPRLFAGTLRDLQAAFSYSIATVPPMQLAVKITNEKGYDIPKVEEAIKNSLLDAGFHVSDEAPILLTGALQRIQVMKTSGFGGARHIAIPRIPVTIQVVETGEVIGSFDVKSKGVDKESQQKAIEMAFDRLKVKRNDLVAALGAAKDRLQPILLSQSNKALKRANDLYYQGKYDEAIEQLSLVTSGEQNLAESHRLMNQIRERKGNN